MTGNGATEAPLKAKDFKSDQMVRWCPGCGDYAVLAALQSILPTIGVPKENIVIISGIGCSSRTPYYVDAYGFHTIHGRAPTIAAGVKVANPELSVWIITGDGDALSIGGNHLIHTLRRNLDVNILLFNNRIYGLTKGQYSPTSEQGKHTGSTPLGSLDPPFRPLSLALGARATFVARTVDRFIPHMKEILERAAAHKGTSFVEVLQNCNIFNDGAFEEWTDKTTRSDRVVEVRHGERLVLGKDSDRAVAVSNGVPFVSRRMEEALAWDETEPSGARAYAIAQMEEDGEMPLPIGVFRCVDAPTIETAIHDQVQEAQEAQPEAGLKDLLYTGGLWEVS